MQNCGSTSDLAEGSVGICYSPSLLAAVGIHWDLFALFSEARSFHWAGSQVQFGLLAGCRGR